jgi:uncharacterized protein YdcH (DUF465 family)
LTEASGERAEEISEFPSPGEIRGPSSPYPEPVLKLNCPPSYDILGGGGVSMDEQALKELMLRENADFRKLYEDHQECEKRLEILQIKSFLSEEEKLEERELKKRKLGLKDKMYLMMAEFRKGR